MLLQRLQHGLRRRLLDIREMMEKVKGLFKGMGKNLKKKTWKLPAHDKVTLLTNIQQKLSSFNLKMRSYYDVKRFSDKHHFQHLSWPFLNSLSSFTTFFSIFFLLSLSFCYSKEFNLNSPANFAYPFCLVCLPAIEQAAFDSQWCSCMDSKGQQIWYGNFRWLWNMKILRIFPYKKKVWHPKTCKTSLHVVSHILCLQGSLL